MIKSSELSWIVVSDLKKARHFFTAILGMEEKSYSEEFGWAEMRGKDGGAMVGIAASNPQDNFPAGMNAIITFTVDDIEKTREELKRKGVALLGEVMEVPGHCKLQLFTDVDGNKFQLYQNTEE